jgi:hypothetical protein
MTLSSKPSIQHIGEFPLTDMHTRHYSLPSWLAETYIASASVAFNEHYQPPQEITLTKEETPTHQATIRWSLPDKRTRAALANRDDANRDGAYACAIAAAEVLFDLYAVHRAETLTGADYYVSSNPEGVDDIEDLEDAYRLEVSGTHLDDYQVKTRLKKKVLQTKQGNSNLPAIAIVVGYKVRRIAYQFVEETNS